MAAVKARPELSPWDQVKGAPPTASGVRVTVVGRGVFDCWRYADPLAVRSLWKIQSCVANNELCWDACFRRCCKVEAEAACVVLGHYGPPRGSSCPVDFVCPLDLQVGSRTRDCRHRLGRLLCDPCDPLGCREVHGRAGSL